MLYFFTKLLQNLKKGDKVGLIGSLQSRKYENNNQQIITKWEMIIDEVDFLTPKTTGTEKLKETIKVEPLPEITDDDLPF